MVLYFDCCGGFLILLHSLDCTLGLWWLLDTVYDWFYFDCCVEVLMCRLLVFVLLVGSCYLLRLVGNICLLVACVDGFVVFSYWLIVLWCVSFYNSSLVICFYLLLVLFVFICCFEFCLFCWCLCLLLLGYFSYLLLFVCLCVCFICWGGLFCLLFVLFSLLVVISLVGWVGLFDLGF